MYLLPPGIFALGPGAETGNGLQWVLVVAARCAYRGRGFICPLLGRGISGGIHIYLMDFLYCFSLNRQ